MGMVYLFASYFDKTKNLKQSGIKNLSYYMSYDLFLRKVKKKTKFLIHRRSSESTYRSNKLKQRIFNFL